MIGHAREVREALARVGLSPPVTTLAEHSTGEVTIGFGDGLSANGTPDQVLPLIIEGGTPDELLLRFAEAGLCRVLCRECRAKWLRGKSCAICGASNGVFPIPERPSFVDGLLAHASTFTIAVAIQHQQQREVSGKWYVCHELPVRRGPPPFEIQPVADRDRRIDGPFDSEEEADARRLLIQKRFAGRPHCEVWFAS